MDADIHIQTVLAAVQLSVYSVLLILAIVKLTKAFLNDKKFLIKFYICVTILTGLELALQIYQLVTLCREDEPSVYLLMIVNLYSMTMEAITIFILGDYWKETWEIITKQSTEQELKDKHNWVRIILVAIWVLIYSAFIGYSLATNRFN